MLLMPSTADPRMKYLFAGMPILFAVFIVNQAFPAGLMLYWITTNLWTVAPGGGDPARSSRRRRSSRCRAAKKKGDDPPPAPRSASRSRPKPKPPAAPSSRAEAKPRSPSSRRGRRSRAARAGRRSRDPSREVRPMSDMTTVEGTGETVGEAKWSALRELEKRLPGLDRQAVEFQVLSEGERGLMGIGREPARVVATLGATPTPEQRAAVAERRPAAARGREPRPAAAAAGTGARAARRGVLEPTRPTRCARSSPRSPAASGSAPRCTWARPTRPSPRRCRAASSAS